MAINERLIHTAAEAAGGTGNQEEGLVLYLDANDVDSYDGDGPVWYDITNHEYTPATDVSEHFNTVTYDGSSSDQSITGVGFQPDLVWIKCRDVANSHVLSDSVRGGDGTRQYFLMTDNTNAQSSSNQIETIDSDGFTVFGDRSATNRLNQEYVAWCFKAGGAPSGSDKVSIDGTSYSTMTAAGLTDGTEAIDKLSVNTKLGFSVVKWTAPALRVDTVAHGLGQTPEMIILKSTSVTRNWNVFHKDVGISKNLHLNTADAANTSEDWTANSTTFSIQDYSASADWVAYCFTSKRGVSKVGSYTGTGASGNKIYTGFEPAWVMIKSTGGGSWLIYDNKRDSSDPRRKVLMPHITNSEYSNLTDINFDADGFTIAESGSSNDNTASVKYIYLAFAKNTKETSLIDDTDLELHLDPASYSGSGTTWTADTGNDATVVASRYDKELGNSFDISTDGESTIQIASGHPLNGEFTLEFWFKFQSTPVAGNRFIYDLGETKVSYFYYQPHGWRFYQASGAESGYYASGSIEVGKWQHKVITLSSSGSFRAYIDGDLIDTTDYNTSWTRPSTSLGAFDFGTTDITADKPKCDIGQIRMYSSVLTADEVRQNYNFTKNDYPSGFHASNTSNPPSFSTDHFQFDRVSYNSGDQMVFGSSINNMLNNLTEYTFTAWYYPDNLSGRNTIFSVGHTTSTNVWALFRVRDNGNSEYSLNDSGTSVGATFVGASGSNDQWNFIAFTISATGAATCRLNGTSYSPTYNVGSSARKFSDVDFNTATIGSFDRGGSGQFYDPFNGRIGQIRLYNKVLSNAEIDAIEALGR